MELRHLADDQDVMLIPLFNYAALVYASLLRALKVVGTASYLLSLFLFIAYCRLSQGQEGPKKEPILEKSESYQRQFVSDFLEIGPIEGYVPGYPKDADHTRDFRLLARYTDWALPIIEERLTQWMIAPEANSNAISNVTNAITYCKAMKAFDVIARVYATRPELRKWISQHIYDGYPGIEPSFIEKWYHALEYPDPEVRTISKEAMLLMLTPPRPLSDGFYYVWGTAILNRHKREPTASELLKDPILEIIRLSNSEHPDEVRQKLAKTSKELFARKKRVEGKKANE